METQNFLFLKELEVKLCSHIFWAGTLGCKGVEIVLFLLKSIISHLLLFTVVRTQKLDGKGQLLNSWLKTKEIYRVGWWSY